MWGDALRFDLGGQVGLHPHNLGCTHQNMTKLAVHVKDHCVTIVLIFFHDVPWCSVLFLGSKIFSSTDIKIDGALDPWSCLYMCLQYVNHRFSGVFCLITCAIVMNNNEPPNSTFTNDKRFVDRRLLWFVNWYSYYQQHHQTYGKVNFPLESMCAPYPLGNLNCSKKYIITHPKI